MSAPSTPSVVNFIQAQPFTLAGSGTTIGDTTILLNSMVGIDGNNIVTADLGSFAYGTLEPGNGTHEEAILFTGVTQNSNGTATLTGVSSIGFKQPYTVTSGLTKTHAGASKFILSNDAAFYNNFTLYLNAIAGAGAANASTVGKGLVQAATSAQINSATPTGSSGAVLAVTPDALATSNYITASYITASAGLVTSLTYNLADSPATWTKPAGLRYINVKIWAGGGSGGSSNGGASGGGGGAYNEKNFIAADLSATETVTVAAGGTSSTGAIGKVGGNTTFGSHLTAYGGGGGMNGDGGGGGGGIGNVGSNGSSAGGTGGTPGGSAGGSSNPALGTSNSGFGGGGGGAGLDGGSAAYGGGGGGGGGNGANCPGGSSYYGGGGGAGAGQASAGGTSTFGGTGGASTAGAGNAGVVPAGGGAGSATVGTASGAGAAGRAVITNYYA